MKGSEQDQESETLRTCNRHSIPHLHDRKKYKCRLVGEHTLLRGLANERECTQGDDSNAHYNVHQQEQGIEMMD